MRLRSSEYRVILLWLATSYILVAPAMAQKIESGSLETFNQPDQFLADVKNLDTQQFVWHPYLDKIFTRPDGVEVRIMSEDNEISGKIYTEDLIYQNSPFEYRNTYNQKGDLIFKQIQFYGRLFYGIYECKDEKCILSKSYSRISSMQPVIPLEQTRAAFLKETGIDLYDATKIRRAHPFGPQLFYVLTYYDDNEIAFDAKTGKVVYRREISYGDEAQVNFIGELEPEGSHAYIKSEAMVKKFMTGENKIHRVYRKVNAKEPDRFYEVFVVTPKVLPERFSPLTESSPLVSFLLDHKKEKILYRFETTLPLMSPSGMPFINFSVEYTQHLKMLEAQEEKPGLFGRFGKKK